MKKIGLLLLIVLFNLTNFFAQETPVHWKFNTKKISDCEYDLQFNASIDDTWHLYSLNKAGDDGPNNTVFTFKKSPDYELVGKTTQSAPIKEFDKMFEMNVEYYKHSASFTQRIKLKSDKKINITGKYEFQACTEEKCIFPPSDEFSFTVQGSTKCISVETSSVAAASINTINPVTIDTVLKTDSVAKSKMDLIQKKDEKIREAVTVEKSTSDLSWWKLLFHGFLFGLAALLTPCVFPMIPMNVGFFLKQSKSKTQGKINALIYALSIVIIFVTLGLSISIIFGAGALHTISTNAIFNLILFVLLVVFAISFFGGFEITLPSSFVNMIDKQSERSGFIGILFMALTLVVVSFSCTGILIGTALVEAAATGSISGPFWIMLGFSLGLAIPFGFFSFFPSMLNSLPQSGGWLNTVKVTLGFIELALALKFASNADLVYQAGYLTREVFVGLWIVIFLLLSLYLLGVFKTSHDSDLKYVSVGRLFIAIASFFVTIYLIPGLWGAPLKLFSGILPPLEYSESPHGFGASSSSTSSENQIPKDDEFGVFMEVNKNGIVHFKNDYEHALAYARKVKKPLLIDFTGHACANCRKTEDYVWPDTEVIKRLNNNVVLVSLYVDDKRALDPKDYMTVQWYGKERQITDIGDKYKYMEESLYNQSTQPLYVLVDGNEKVLNTIRGYNPSIPEYITWLDEGVANFKK